jgi:UDP-N-acetylmuramate dehydrogenase
MNWQKGLIRGKIKFKEPLRDKTTFKIGGSAKFFIEPKDIEDLKLLINLLKRDKIPHLVMGAGSNLLISDKGVKAAVIRLNAPYFGKITKRSNCLNVGSGLALNQLLRIAKENSLSGVEFSAGIPGTVGGAVMMNAGAGDRSFGDLVKEVKVMDYDGRIKVLRKKDIKFTYRKSSLAGYIILSAALELTKGNKEKINKEIKKFLEYRRNSQDKTLPNAGCIFKNPKGESTGRLIDLCGLKGKTIGDACISRIHANFILNKGNAKAEEVLKLMDLIRKKVKSRFNINLQPEIKIWQ